MWRGQRKLASGVKGLCFEKRDKDFHGKQRLNTLGKGPNQERCLFKEGILCHVYNLQLQQAETFFFIKRRVTTFFFFSFVCHIWEDLENLLVFVVFPAFLILKISDVNSSFAGGHLCGCTSCTLIELIREKELNI